jgi:hypothetical protein
LLALSLGGPFPLPLASQQFADTAYRPRIHEPAWVGVPGPRVLVDRGHNAFHADEDDFGILERLLVQDGYRVEGLREPFSAASLAGAEMLVVVDALNAADVDEWVLPTSPAFTPGEVAAVRAWVEEGGGLLLIADHMPFPGAAEALGRAFGVELMNGFAVVESDWDPLVFRRSHGGLRSHPVTDGRHPGERVDSAVTFVSGHAFRPLDAGACPLLVFGPGVVSINMERAWFFDDATPRVPVEGWLPGAAVEAGRGRAVILGEAAMFAAQLVGPRQQPVGLNSSLGAGNLQFLLNTVRWLSRAPGFDGAGAVDAERPCGPAAAGRSAAAAPTRQ